MLCPPMPETAVEFDPTLGRLLAPWLARPDAVLPPGSRPTPTASSARYAIYSCGRKLGARKDESVTR